MKIFTAIPARQALEKTQAECFKKSGDVPWQRGWTRNQGNAIDPEASALKARGVIARRWEVPRNS